jgi:hypothetical protein
MIDPLSEKARELAWGWFFAPNTPIQKDFPWSDNEKADVARVLAALRDVQRDQLAVVERMRQHELTGPIPECACASCNLHHHYATKLRDVQRETREQDAQLVESMEQYDARRMYRAIALAIRGLSARLREIKP